MFKALKHPPKVYSVNLIVSHMYTPNSW